MISKNEEKNIEKCINSVINLADEIVLVDTGSTDKTVEIAEKLGVKVIKHSWKNDFSDARNKSIDNATKDWILFLDCDEELPLEEGFKFKQLIDNDNVHEAYYLRLVNIIEGTIVSDAIVLRAFKNRPEYRFVGKMHEQVITSIQNLKGIESIGETPVQIYHYGYDPKVSDADEKSRRNLEILLSYDEKDKDGYYYYVLGNEYARVDDYKEALRIYDMSLKRTNAKMFRYIYYPYLIANIVKTLYVQKRYYDSVKKIDEVKDTLPYYKDMYFLEALAYIEMAKLSKASEALDRYTNCPSGNYEYPSNKYENFHDIPKLITDLNAGMIPHEEDMLSVWIPMNTYDENIIDCIKSVNETSLEVFVITIGKTDVDLHADKIRQVGGKILNISEANAHKAFQMAMKQTRGKNVLLINPNELCSQVSQIQIRNLLTEDDDMGDGFGLRILNMETNEFELRFSLFKTNKKMTSLEEYMNYLKAKNLFNQDVEIQIHKKSGK